MSLQYSRRRSHRREPNVVHDEYESNLSLTVRDTNPQISDLLFHASNLSATEEQNNGLSSPPNRRSSFRDCCFTALSSVRNASSRILSQLTQSSQLSQNTLVNIPPVVFSSKEDTGPLTLGTDAFWTAVRSYSPEQKPDYGPGATYNIGDSTSSRQKFTSGDDFVLRDIFGCLVRPRPRLLEYDEGERLLKKQSNYESTISSEEDLSDSSVSQVESDDSLSKVTNEDTKRKRSIFKIGLVRNDRKHGGNDASQGSLASVQKENGGEALENESIALNNKPFGKIAKLCQGPYRGLFGRNRSRESDEDDEENLDSLCPYYSNGTTVRPELAMKVKRQAATNRKSGMAAVRVTHTSKSDDDEDDDEKAECSKRRLSGISDGIVSCESGPLPSWIEEAVWEVETTESFLVD